MIQTVNRYLYDIYKSIWLQSIQFIVMEPVKNKNKWYAPPPSNQFTNCFAIWYKCTLSR